MWKIIVVLAAVKSATCGIFDFTEYDDPYNTNFFFNRPAVGVRQHHGRCISSTDGTNQEGVCLSRPECMFSGGQPNGRQSCYLGTCCVYSSGCSQTTSKRVSYFEGSTQNVDNNICTYIVRAESNNICQMRLDLDSLNLPAPTRSLIPGSTAGETIPIGPYVCRDAFFQVESPNNNGRIPTLCGNNNGQHIYVPVNASRGERELVIKIVNNAASNNNNGNSVSWKIKITQIECPGLNKHQRSQRVHEDSFLKAPDGCLQYHQAQSGTIRSLGYSTAGTIANNHYQANLNYAICFRRNNDMCGLEFNVDEFRLGGIYDPTAAIVPTASWCNVPITAESTIYRDADFLFIPNGVYIFVDNSSTTNVASSINEDRYCGTLSANTVVRSVTPGPFYIFFKTDNQVLGSMNTPYPDQANAEEVAAPTADPENGWELTYSTLYGSSCGSLN